MLQLFVLLRRVFSGCGADIGYWMLLVWVWRASGVVMNVSLLSVSEFAIAA